MPGTSLPLWCLGLKDLHVITRNVKETELHIPSIMSLCHSRESSTHGQWMTIDLLSLLERYFNNSTFVVMKWGQKGL